MSTAYLDGEAIFGLAVQCAHTPKPSANQINSFFGVTGTQSLYGGGRGRAFMIQGVLFGVDQESLGAVELNLLSYADGIGRTFTDTMGNSWSNVVFYGEYQPHGKIEPGAAVDPDTGDVVLGFCRAYKAVLHGLT